MPVLYDILGDAEHHTYGIISKLLYHDHIGIQDHTTR